MKNFEQNVLFTVVYPFKNNFPQPHFKQDIYAIDANGTVITKIRSDYYVAKRIDFSHHHLSSCNNAHKLGISLCCRKIPNPIAISGMVLVIPTIAAIALNIIHHKSIMNVYPR